MNKLPTILISTFFLVFSHLITSELHAEQVATDKTKTVSSEMPPPMHEVRKRIVTRLMTKLGYVEKTQPRTVASSLTSRMVFLEQNRSSLVDRMTKLGFSKTYSAKLINSELSSIRYAISAILSNDDPEDKISTYNEMTDTVTIYLPGMEGEYDLEQLCPYAVVKPECAARGDVPLDYITTGSTGASWVICCDVNKGVDYGFSISDQDYSDCIDQINEAIQMAKNKKAEREGENLDVGDQINRLNELDQMLDDIADLIRAEEEEEQNKEDSENTDDDNTQDDTTSDDNDDGSNDDSNSGDNKEDKSQG